MYSIYLMSISIFLLDLKNCLGVHDKIKSICNNYARSCGNRQLNPLIVGGEEANPKEFPHMALIAFGEDNDLQWECGGALISKTFVLSAAHCGDSREYGPAKKAKFGVTDRDETGSNVQEVSIKRVIIHPDYKRPVKYHDIALFELSKDVQFNEYVWPACLNTQKSVKGMSPNAIGFGKTSFTEEKGHQKLKKVSLPVLDNDECQPFYASMKVSTLNQGGLIESQICAGVIKGGQDTCQGDSGGPLQVFMDAPQCTFNVIGVTSFGKFCGYAKSPAIYTHVYYYVSWISENVWGSR